MSFHVYILYSTGADSFYVGHTGDELTERLRNHNSNHKGFTGNTGDWQIVYKCDFATKAEAYAEERKIKGWKSKTRIRELIARAGSEHPAL